MRYFLVSLITAVFYIIIRSRKSLHMLQQNWYNDGSRYIKWMNHNKNKVFNIYEVVLMIILVFFSKTNWIMISALIGYGILFRLYLNDVKKEQSKKPLALTARVKRLIVTISLIYIIPFALLFLLTEFKYVNLYAYYVLLFILVFNNFIIVLLANIINKPVEKLVFYSFKNKATKKLNDMKLLKRVGITGSYGKTSSKNIITDILNIKYNTTPTPKNFNTTYGLIRSINEYLDKFSDVFIAEMGAFRKGEIKELCDLVKPEYGVLTTIGVAHLETFGSRENIQQGKFELIESLPEHGVGILNMDDPYQVSYKLKNKCKIVWIGIENKKADVLAQNIKSSHRGTEFDVVFKGDKEKYHFETKLLGNANIYNILAGIALGREFGLKISELQAGVRKVLPVEHRLELKKMGDIFIIDDAYNSNPVGSKMALEVLNLMPGKKIVVTPGMIDLGKEEAHYNKEFGKYIADVADEVILVGEKQTKPIYEGLISKKYNKKNIHVINDVKIAFKLIRELKGKETYALLENDLPDIFNE